MYVYAAHGPTSICSMLAPKQALLACLVAAIATAAPAPAPDQLRRRLFLGTPASKPLVAFVAVPAYNKLSAIFPIRSTTVPLRPVQELLRLREHLCVLLVHATCWLFLPP